MPGESKIKFFYPYRDFSLVNRRLLKNFLASLIKKEGKRFNSLHYVFCDDAYLVKLNKHWFKHDTYTDIITFNLGTPSLIKGEIYISVERVRENAQIYKTSISGELKRVMIHGALHLCGYKDKKPSEKLKMRNLEDKYLKEYIS